MRFSMLVAALALSAVSLGAHADTITYTLSGNFSGSLGSTNFTDAASTFTFVADSAGITDLTGGYFLNTAGTGTITIAGVGTATFTDAGFGALGSVWSAGFFDTDTGFAVGILDESLADYDLSAGFTDTAYFVDGFTGIAGPEATTLGDLTITDGDFENPTTTFSASLAVSPVPEPSSLLLIGTGALGIAGAIRRRIA